MKRDASLELAGWLARSKRKPLIIRGARQVGKSFLVRDFAKAHHLELVELNFERDPRSAGLFDAPGARTVRDIEAFTGKRLGEKSLLFVDEIQAAPEVLGKLRWLSEEVSQLAVIAAGSLLDFVLADHKFSMPVGRISYMHLEPMSFGEFLRGLGDDRLADELDRFELQRGIAPAIHELLLERLREYILVGGMPEAVEAYRTDRSFLESSRVQHDLLATFRDDFAKYAGAAHRPRMIKVLDAVPRMLGQKFVYSRVDREERAAALRQAVDLLCGARVCHRIQATQATGVPVGAGADDRRFKLILLDVGLASASLGLSMSDLSAARDLVLANEGAIAEQVVGQLLRVVDEPFREPALHYWARDVPGSEAEVDYVVQHGKVLVPIEVKAGTTGTLRSLHSLMASRKWPRAVRFNADRSSTTEVAVPTDKRARVYELVSLPLYLAGHLGRVLGSR